MQMLIRNALVYGDGELSMKDVALSHGHVVDISLVDDINSGDAISLSDKLLVPGFVDVHVHLREPGFFYKETIESGTRAAAHGGYTAVCAMPNLNPAPDTLENLKVQLDIIEKTAKVHVYPYGCITQGGKGAGTLCDFEALSPYVCGFSDDGKGVQSEDTMREAMKRIHAIGGMVVAHCEDETLLHGGYIHDGEYAKAHGHKGICSESEWGQVERDLKLAKETGCKYHVCHVSSKESVALIRQAKAEDVDVTCETAPHYLLMCDMDLQEDGRFRMNPPIRSAADRDALVAGLLDGTVDMIATDHAPHSAQEKSKGLSGSAFGVVGLECAFPALYTGLVKTGKVPLEVILKAMTDTPRERFGLPKVSLEQGAHDFTVFDLNEEYTVNPDEFLSMGRATPLAGMRVWGRCIYTWVGGEMVWQR